MSGAPDAFATPTVVLLVPQKKKCVMGEVRKMIKKAKIC